MEKKESLKPKDQETKPGLGKKLGPKLEKFLTWLFGVIKFILGIFLLPFVYSATKAFLGQFVLIDQPQQNYFWSGAVAFLIIYHLIWEPVKIYNFGHKILEWVFSFFAPLVKVAPYLLPIYTLTLAVIYLLIYKVVDSPKLIHYFMFAFGASFVLHLVFSAKTIRGKKDDFLKSNYIFGYSLIYIIDIFMFVALLGLIFPAVSFLNFSTRFYDGASQIYGAVFTQLFL